MTKNDRIHKIEIAALPPGERQQGVGGTVSDLVRDLLAERAKVADLIKQRDEWKRCSDRWADRAKARSAQLEATASAHPSLYDRVTRWLLGHL